MKSWKHLVQGAIEPGKLGELLAKHQSKTEVGAHAYFLGQVRADQKENAFVTGIEYSAYEEMAEKEIHAIKEEAFAKYSISCAHIFHSLGLVKTGECSLLVMVSSPHRKQVYPPLEFIVDEIKKRVPVWKKEFLDNGSHIWIDGQPKV